MRRTVDEVMARDVIRGIEAVEITPHLGQFFGPPGGQRFGRLVGGAAGALPVAIGGLRRVTARKRASSSREEKVLGR